MEARQHFGNDFAVIFHTAQTVHIVVQWITPKGFWHAAQGCHALRGATLGHVIAATPSTPKGLWVRPGKLTQIPRE